jgi:multimeric flavodoxin WrbA
MKVVAFNGSPRREGNTAQIIEIVLGELAKHGVETEVVQVGGIGLRGCTSCYSCQRNKATACAITVDPLNEWIEKIMAADGILLGSPVYVHDVTSDMKAMIDRVGFVARANGRMFTQKAGAGVVAVRRVGAMHALDTMLNFFMSMQMYAVGGSNVVVASKLGDVDKDLEGVQHMTALGHNMARLLEMMAAYRKSYSC